MTREEAIDAYSRVVTWRESAIRRLLDNMRSQGVCDPIPLTLHNWGNCAGREPYKRLHREYEYRLSVIRSKANRLEKHFASYF